MSWKNRCCRAAIVLAALWSLVGAGLIPVPADAALWTESAGAGNREDSDLARLDQAWSVWPKACDPPSCKST